MILRLSYWAIIRQTCWSQTGEEIENKIVEIIYYEWIICSHQTIVISTVVKITAGEDWRGNENDR